MSKKTIAVDIDDVLATSVESWISYSNKKWGTRLTVNDYDEDWAKMWGVDHQEGKKRASHLYQSGIVGTFNRFDDAEQILKDLAKKYKLVITTSRVLQVEKDTLEWIDRHYKGIFEEVHLARIFDAEHKEPIKMTKRELCETIGADYLIDDHPKHCFAVAEAGITALLFGSYAWNRGIKNLPKNVVRVHNWAAVEEYFDRQG